MTHITDITEPTICHDCKTKNPYRYAWDNPCCRVRFLLGQPNREARQAWCARWRQAGEGAMVDAVIRRLQELKP